MQDIERGLELMKKGNRCMGVAVVMSIADFALILAPVIIYLILGELLTLATFWIGEHYSCKGRKIYLEAQANLTEEG